jgi:hypothetical protein
VHDTIAQSDRVENPLGGLAAALGVASPVWLTNGSAPLIVLDHVPLVNAATTTSYSADGSVRFQRVTGFAVNANPDNWRGGQLRPALDTLVDTLNATVWRVEFDGFSRWERSMMTPILSPLSG